jgi:hypothetical protein
MPHANGDFMFEPLPDPRFIAYRFSDAAEEVIAP